MAYGQTHLVVRPDSTGGLIVQPRKLPWKVPCLFT